MCSYLKQRLMRRAVSEIPVPGDSVCCAAMRTQPARGQAKVTFRSKKRSLRFSDVSSHCCHALFRIHRPIISYSQIIPNVLVKKTHKL